MTADVFSHPWLSGLFGDDEIAAYLSANTTLAHMIAVEVAFAKALGESGAVDRGIAQDAVAAIEQAKIKFADLKDATSRDGLAVPELVRQLKSNIPTSLHHAVHEGMTSQDVIDTSLVLALKSCLLIFDRRLGNVISALQILKAGHGDAPMMGRTRMQAALPITVADRVRAWHAPLLRHAARLSELMPRLLVLQLGGAVGDRAALGAKSSEIAEIMADTLGLHPSPESWHNTRDTIAELASWLSLVTGSLGKMGQDIALMAQQGIDEVILSGGGGSSAIPHKQNPILAELLVTLAKFNATQLSGVHFALVHEQERSGIAWALEWMILPQMLQATGRALTAAETLCSQVERLGANESPATSE